MWRKLMNQESMGGTGGGGEMPPQPPSAPSAQPNYNYPPRPTVARKSPVLAGLLSMIPGLGQVYVGYYSIGFIHLLLMAGVITVLSSGDARGVEPFLGMFLAFFWFYNIIDAARRASMYNRAAEGGRMDEFDLPTDPPGPVFGVGLIVVGFLLLMVTRFDFELWWVREWWPAGLILAGAYITRKNLQDKA